MRLFAILVALISLSSCGTVGHWLHHRDKPEDTQPEVGAMTSVGSIEMVNPESKFVIVRLGSNAPIPADTTLTAVSPTGTVCKLKVTPERKGIFATADIVEGEPHRGDTVVFKYEGKPATPATTTPSNEPLPPLARPAASPTISITPGQAAPSSQPSPNEFLRVVPTNPQ
jgi:hypothetical protein